MILKTIAGFQGQYRFLSNFWPCGILYEGILYPSTEHAYQAAKTLDIEARKEMASMSSPSDVKRAGRKAYIRYDWESIKETVMEDVLRIKFSEPALMLMLKETSGAELIESNSWHDQFYGDCICPKHKSIAGKNVLGKILMRIRDEVAQ